MAEKFTSLVLFLHFLLIIMCPYGSSGTENKVMDGDSKMEMDPSLIGIFQMKDLKVGRRMPIIFGKLDPSKSPKLLTREEADSIPFSLDQLQYLLKIFSFSQGSPQAKSVETTLRECELIAIKGELRFCATSSESMLEFAQSVLGLDSDPIALATSQKAKPSVTLQNYTILEGIMEVQAPKSVACHAMPYPYVVYVCHIFAGGHKVFRVPLAGDNGDKVEAMALCHMDTSQFTNPSLQLIGIIPGSSTLCHFFPYDDSIIWVPKGYANGFSSAM